MTPPIPPPTHTIDETLSVEVHAFVWAMYPLNQPDVMGVVEIPKGAVYDGHSTEIVYQNGMLGHHVGY